MTMGNCMRALPGSREVTRFIWLLLSSETAVLWCLPDVARDADAILASLAPEFYLEVTTRYSDRLGLKTLGFGELKLDTFLKLGRHIL